MKFTSRLFGVGILAASTVLLLFTANSVNACELDCRVGISHAFADKYAIEVVPRFNLFSTNIKNNLFQKVNLADFVSASKGEALKSQILSTLNNKVPALNVSFVNSLADLIQNAIFEQTPKFKGQCQNPLRVIQPPAGQAWKDSDCDDQDYICGNPPAICHFMGEIVKPRNVKNVIKLLGNRASKNGAFFKDLNSAIQKVTSKFITKKNKLEGLNKKLAANLQVILSAFVNEFTGSFCKGTSCDKYDSEIKKLLLSFP